MWKDGAQYAGDWFGDKPSGFGVENYPDGSSYIGQYEDDMRHGYGTYTFPSGIALSVSRFLAVMRVVFCFSR